MHDTTPARAGELPRDAHFARYAFTQAGPVIEGMAPGAAPELTAGFGFSLPYRGPDPLPAPLGEPAVAWDPKGYADLSGPFQAYIQVTTAGPVVPCPSCLTAWAWLAPQDKGCFIDARRGCTAGCAPASIARAHYQRVLSQRPPTMRRWGRTKREAYLNAESVLMSMLEQEFGGPDPTSALYNAADFVGELCAMGELHEARLQNLAICIGRDLGLDFARARGIVLIAFANGWNRRWGLDG